MSFFDAPTPTPAPKPKEDHYDRDLWEKLISNKYRGFKAENAYNRLKNYLRRFGGLGEFRSFENNFWNSRKQVKRILRDEVKPIPPKPSSKPIQPESTPSEPTPASTPSRFAGLNLRERLFGNSLPAQTTSSEDDYYDDPRAFVKKYRTYPTHSSSRAWLANMDGVSIDPEMAKAMFAIKEKQLTGDEKLADIIGDACRKVRSKEITFLCDVEDGQKKMVTVKSQFINELFFGGRAWIERKEHPIFQLTQQKRKSEVVRDAAYLGQVMKPKRGEGKWRLGTITPVGWDEEFSCARLDDINQFCKRVKSDFGKAVRALRRAGLIEVMMMGWHLDVTTLAGARPHIHPIWRPLKPLSDEEFQRVKNTFEAIDGVKHAQMGQTRNVEQAANYLMRIVDYSSLGTYHIARLWDQLQGLRMFEFYGKARFLRAKWHEDKETPRRCKSGKGYKLTPKPVGFPSPPKPEGKAMELDYDITQLDKRQLSQLIGSVQEFRENAFGKQTICMSLGVNFLAEKYEVMALQSSDLILQDRCNISRASLFKLPPDKSDEEIPDSPLFEVLVGLDDVSIKPPDCQTRAA